MPPLSTFLLPLQPDGPPTGYVWAERAMSDSSSTTTAFRNGIEQRDTFLGRGRCIICGSTADNEPCSYIIMASEPRVWNDLKNRNWIPSQAKDHPQHEPRNGLLMCPNHHKWFNSYRYFIRFLPGDRKFVLINYSNMRGLHQEHGKAIALDITDRHAPFPSLLIIHETRVRGFNPFQSTSVDIPDAILWQDWITKEDAASGFKRDRPSRVQRTGESQTPFPAPTVGVGTSSDGRRKLEMNADVVADILAATHAMPSWKACEMEGTSWNGTADENIRKYADVIGVEHEDSGVVSSLHSSGDAI